jgi:hypothetical protein
MKRFSTVDLDKNLGDVKAAAASSPVIITEHRKPRFVLMSVDTFERYRTGANPRRVYGKGETPEPLASMFIEELEKFLASGEHK